MQIQNINKQQNFGKIKYYKFTSQQTKNDIQKNILPRLDMFAVDTLDEQGYDIYVNIKQEKKFNGERLEYVTFNIYDKIEQKPVSKRIACLSDLSRGMQKFNSYLNYLID